MNPRLDKSEMDSERRAWWKQNHSLAQLLDRYNPFRQRPESNLLWRMQVIRYLDSFDREIPLGVDCQLLATYYHAYKNDPHKAAHLIYDKRNSGSVIDWDWFFKALYAVILPPFGESHIIEMLTKRTTILSHICTYELDDKKPIDFIIISSATESLYERLWPARPARLRPSNYSASYLELIELDCFHTKVGPTYTLDEACLNDHIGTPLLPIIEAFETAN